jgi:hypothetical protein
VNLRDKTKWERERTQLFEFKKENGRRKKYLKEILIPNDVG